ncbi:DUF475 domain-containing protein [Blattabacterium cuenoti]|uniref:DUF475 domain-containing protein n=1 Tax=Blattabacterium cuenoti TaxID=1653831 RepID=UPI00163D337F|nr:DUF475 domain-containing protein [Blattabacterium cuenoti]
MKNFFLNSIIDIVENPLISISIIGNLFFIESILSIDNAAVLASMIMDLKKEDRKRALKYGIFGAYFFRGIALLCASFLIKIWWLKPLGGLYLIYLGLNYFFSSKNSSLKKNKDRKLRNSFWMVLLSIEIMDLAFSIDNLFAAVALSENFLLIFLGVFIGILAMRFATQGFVKLLELYPFLKNSAFSVILLLGIKLLLSPFIHSIFSNKNFSLEGFFSFFTVAIFLFPMIISWIFSTTKNKLN